METFKQIGDTGYKISNLGRVESPTGHILVPFPRGSGHLAVKLGDDTVSVHRLVADAFVSGKSDVLNVVNHKDGVKWNNFDFNLEWCTQQHNVNHAIGRDFKVVSPDGVLYEGRGLTQFAREHGLHERTFRKLVAGTVHNHRGWTRWVQ